MARGWRQQAKRVDKRAVLISLFWSLGGDCFLHVVRKPCELLLPSKG